VNVGITFIDPTFGFVPEFVAKNGGIKSIPGPDNPILGFELVHA
jgi:hypothetical protein